MTGSEENGAPEAPGDSGGGGRSWTRILTVAGTLVTVAAGGVGLLFKLEPSFEPCVGGSAARFVDVPVFPESRAEYGYVSGQANAYSDRPNQLGAEVRATVEIDNLRGSQLELYYTLLSAGDNGAADQVVPGADQIPTRTQTADACTWTGGFDVFVEPKPTTLGGQVVLPTGLDPKKGYRIVLELFRGQREPDGANRLALFESPVFRG